MDTQPTAPDVPAAQTRQPPLAVLLIVAVIVGVGAAVGVMAAIALRGAAEGPVTTASLVIGQLATQLVMIAGAVAMAGWRGADRRAMLAIGPPAGGARSYLEAIAAAVLVLGSFNLVAIFGLGHDAWSDLKPFVPLVRNDLWLLALLMIGIGAPLSEELLFRGYLQSGLTPTPLGYWGAAVVTTLFWGMLHAGYSAIGMIEVLLIGLVFAWSVWRSGSIRPALLIHAVYNSGLTLLLKFGPVPI
jgi:membrane protease YdiL (CAAX protease family)